MSFAVKILERKQHVHNKPMNAILDFLRSCSIEKILINFFDKKFKGQNRWEDWTLSFQILPSFWVNVEEYISFLFLEQELLTPSKLSVVNCFITGAKMLQELLLLLELNRSFLSLIVLSLELRCCKSCCSYWNSKCSLHASFNLALPFFTEQEF